MVVGVPGVGKSTVLLQAASLLRQHSRQVEMRVFGSVMFDEAKKMGVQHRDDMRRLALPVQRRLQLAAAERIARETADILFVDTHLFIRTPEGFWPGLPAEVLTVLRPTNLVLIEASAADILSRRSHDADRHRDAVPDSEILRDLEIGRAMCATAGVLSGAPVLTLVNVEGHADQTAHQLVAALEGQ